MGGRVAGFAHPPLEKSAPGFKNARLPIPATPIPPRLDLSRSVDWLAVRPDDS
jgi:hypothetical protein